MTLYIIILASVLLVIGLVVYFVFKRNYFNKYKYIRLVKYRDDMSVTVSYIKKDKFNQDNALMINPNHVYNFKGYQTIITTNKVQETINPIDFNSKYDPAHFKSAMKSKLIAETFASLKVDKFDKLMFLLLLNILQLIAIAYLLYNVLGKVTP
jgi:hypothetical protein